MSDAHGGGGGGFDTKFFVGIALGLALIWLFGLYRTGELFGTPDENVSETPGEELSEEQPLEEEDTTREYVREDVTPREYSYREQPPLPPGHPPLAEHGITYYLDANGDIIDVYRY